MDEHDDEPKSHSLQMPLILSVRFCSEYRRLNVVMYKAKDRQHAERLST